MARKKKQIAAYICVKDCTFDYVNEEGELVRKLFRRYDTDEFGGTNGAVSEQQLKHSSLEHDSHLQVPKGELVCHHFIPDNDVAEDDRDDQIENPQKYIETERDLVLIAEIMAHAGGFSSKRAAVAAIESILPASFRSNILASGVDVEHEKLIESILGEGDEKAQRKRVLALLKEHEIRGYFPAWKPRKLAEIAIENDLHEQ